MSTYQIALQGEILTIGFGEPAQNDRLVRDAAAKLEAMVAAGELQGGALLKINGPTSLPVAFVLAHRLAHLYGAIAVFDPKLAPPRKYVVCITHNPDYKLGDLVE